MSALQDCFVGLLTGSDVPGQTHARAVQHSSVVSVTRVYSQSGVETVTRLVLPTNRSRAGFEIFISGSEWVFSYGAPVQIADAVHVGLTGGTFRTSSRDPIWTGPIYGCPLGSGSLSGSAVVVTDHSYG